MDDTQLAEEPEAPDEVAAEPVDAAPDVPAEDANEQVDGPADDLASTSARGLLAVAALAGVFIAAAPQTVFPVCEYLGMFRTGPNGEHLLMRCHETAVIAVWLGAALAAVGVGGAIWGTRRAAQATGAVLLLGGFVSAILPLVIAPVCKSATMPCVAGTQPALVVSGVFTMVIGAAAFVLGLRRRA